MDFSTLRRYESIPKKNLFLAYNLWLTLFHVALQRKYFMWNHCIKVENNQSLYSKYCLSSYKGEPNVAARPKSMLREKAAVFAQWKRFLKRSHLNNGSWERTQNEFGFDPEWKLESYQVFWFDHFFFLTQYLKIERQASTWRWKI